MQRCLQLAQLGEYYVAPNPMVGAVLVSDEGVILAEGWHQKFGGPHAEVNCFLDAERKGVTGEQIHSATLYVSLEPCSHYGKTPPCAELIVSKRPKRVVCGMKDPNPQVAGRGIERLQQEGIELTVGVLEKECRYLNRRFLMLHEHKRPYIILKWAQTADGFLDYKRDIPSNAPECAGTCNAGEPLAISTPQTKQLVHKMRAENMAIMVGSGTILLDNPHLTNTHWQGRNPVRIVLDRRHRINVPFTVLHDADKPSHYLTNVPKTIILHDTDDLHDVFRKIGAMNIHSVLVEGGAQILHALIEEKLFDEMHIEVNPRLRIGDGVAAPQIPLHDSECQIIDGNRLYTLL